MARSGEAARRTRGSVTTLPSGSLRVRVYAGYDPVTGGRHHLDETIPAGKKAEREAEKARTRLLNQVDERRHPRSSAPVNQPLDRWLKVLDVEPSTRRGYLQKIDKHIRPLLGAMPVARLTTEDIESFYATPPQVPRPLPRPQIRPTSHRENPRVRRALPSAQVQGPGRRQRQAVPLDPQRSAQSRGEMALDRDQPGRPRRQAVAAASRPDTPVSGRRCAYRHRGLEGPRLGDVRLARDDHRGAPR